jgi:hypothetical protein
MAIFTQEHYAFVAAHIWDDLVSPSSRSAEEMIYGWAGLFKLDDPSFDEEAFIQRCGLEPEP